MWRGLLGKKLGMTQIFTEKGERIGVTVIEAGPCAVLQIKAADGPDGYHAYQLGFGQKRASRAPRAELGHANPLTDDDRKAREAAARGKKKAPARDMPNPASRFVREIRLRGPQAGLEIGATLTLADWEDVAVVQVTGTSKGKGFQGVMKRHGFHGLRATHGVKTHHRIPGSSGSLTPARVVKGRKAPGHMGHTQVTTKGLKVAQVRAGENLLLVQGAVPGPAGGFVIIRPAQPYRPD